MDDTLPRLIQAAQRAIARGDMYVGQAADFPSVHEYSRMMDIPIGVFEGRVLLKLKVPRHAISPTGNIVKVVSHYGGHYYTTNGEKYTINSLAFIEDKRLP